METARRIQLTPNDITARADFYYVCDNTEVLAPDKLGSVQ